MKRAQTLKNKFVQGLIVAVAATSIGVGTMAFAESQPEHVAQPEANTQKLNKKQRRAKFKNMTPEQRAAFKAKRLERRMAKLTKKLNLSDDQAKQLKSTFQAMHKEIAQVRQQNKGDRKAIKKAARPIRKAYKAEFAKILTEEQMATFSKMKKRKHKKMRRAKGKRRFQAMIKKLNLTQTQQQQLQTIRAERRKQAKAIIAKANGNRKEAKPQLKALRKSTKKQIFAILTPEQQQQMKSLRKNRRKGKKRDSTSGPF